MSDLTEKIQALEKENKELKYLTSTTRDKINGLRAAIKVLKEEFPEHKNYDIAQLLPQVVRVEL